MKQYHFILEPYKGPASRYRCPGCNQPRQFTRYIDAVSGEPVADEVGICNRTNRCGYHYTPKQYFAEHPTNDGRPKKFKRAEYKATPPPIMEYLPPDLLTKSCRDLETNNLFNAFIKWVGKEAANNVFQRYRVGSSKHWPGATAFWQIDTKGRLRQCKVMQYDAETGKRVKDGADKVFFAGKAILNSYTANLQQCFFGEHLLNENPDWPVAIVESEKTAIYCSIYHPNLIWLATGGKQGCRWTEKEVCKVFENRTVILFPDLQATDLWKQKAAEIAGKVKCRIHVSEDLEALASDAEKDAGLDLMDYLLAQRLPINKIPDPASLKLPAKSELMESIKRGNEPGFIDAEKDASQEFSYIEKKGLFPRQEMQESGNQGKGRKTKEAKREYWQLNKLEHKLPQFANSRGIVRLNNCTTIIDMDKFIESHLAALKANNGNKYFQPYFDRLQQLVNKSISGNSI